MMNGQIKVGARLLEGAKTIGYFRSKVIRTPINKAENQEWNLRVNKANTLGDLITLVGLLGSLEEVTTLGATIKREKL